MTYRELAEDVVVGLRGVGVFAEGAFDDGQAERPDVGLHAVGSAAGVGARLGDAAA